MLRIRKFTATPVRLVAFSSFSSSSSLSLGGGGMDGGAALDGGVEVRAKGADFFRSSCFLFSRASNSGISTARALFFLVR